MLLSFTVENHRSIRDEQVLSLTSGDDVLAATALYGGNASGKTNVLDALVFAKWAVQSSQTNFDPLNGVPRVPFAWGPSRAHPSLFELEFRLGGVRFEYGFVVDDHRVIEEWLNAWPLQRKQTWFERDESGFRFGEHLKGENKVIEKLTRANSLFLSAAAQNNHEQLEPIFRWFRAFQCMKKGDGELSRVHRSFGDWWSRATTAQASLFDRAEPSKSSLFMQLLQTADVGIVEVRATVDKAVRGGFHVEARHRGATDDAWLPLDEESDGTVRLFELGPSVVDALDAGSVVIIDELEASFHPMLALRLLQIFNDPEQNPKRAQLVFSTHDTNLLGNITGEPALKREQVWFTEKDSEGATKLYPLTDFKPRKVENLERGYLQGRYGAIPFLGSPRVLGAK